MTTCRSARLIIRVLCFFLIAILPTSLLAQKKIAATAVSRNSAIPLSNVFRKYSVFQINTAEIAQYAKLKKNGPIDLDLEFEGLQSMKLKLVEHNILSPDYQLIVNGTRQTFAKMDCKTFSGKLGSDMNSSVYLTITDQVIHGFIKGNGKEYFIEPLKYFAKQANPNAYVLYEREEVVPNSGGTCGVTEVMQRSEQTFNSEEVQRATGTCKMVEVALASDDSMVLRYGSPAVVAERNIGIMNMMVGIFQNTQIGLQFLEFKIKGQYISTQPATNPLLPNYNGNDADILLDNFANWGQSGAFHFTYDIAQLWTTRDIASSGSLGVIGLAAMGGACNPRKYQLLEDFVGSSLSKAVVAAHETGHNLNANHDNFSGYVMAPSISNPPSTTFSTSSISVINNFINGVGGICLSPCTPGPVEARFNISPSALCLGNAATFTDNSIGNVTRRYWSFANGANPSFATNETVTVGYSTPGLKYMELTVENAYDYDMLAKKILVSTAPTASPIIRTPYTASNGGIYTFQLADISYEVSTYWIGGSRYTDLSCSDITALSPGKTYMVKSDIGTKHVFPSTNNPTKLQLLLDYNNDGDFLDENEMVFNTVDCHETAYVFTITIPETVPLINQFVRMRAIGLPCELDITNGNSVPQNAHVLDFSVYFLESTCLKTYYQDSDIDGYGNPDVSISSCTPLAGYVLNNRDCNDNVAAIYPGAKEICDAIDNDCDGLVDEGVKTTYYIDSDEDGHGDPAVSQQACQAPAGFVISNDDCNDADASIYTGAQEICDGKDNDCDGSVDEGVKTTYYRDNDQDGYGNPSDTKQACSPPAGYITANGDCNDNDPTINNGAVEVCGNGKDDNCNGITDEANCYVCVNTTSFSTSNISSTSATFNWVSIPHPAEWQIQYKATSNGSKWKDVFVTGNKRSYTATDLVPGQNYIWHIRAKCGKNYTLYSVSIPFTTLTDNSTLITRTIPAAKESDLVLEQLNVKGSPNPTKGNFRIAVTGTNYKQPVQLIVTDLAGRVIETRITSTGQVIILGEKYGTGTYLLRIIQGNVSRQLKLIKISE